MTGLWSRRSLLWTAAGACLPARTAPVERSFRVLQLLYPRRLLVRPVGTVRLHCESPESAFVVEGRGVLALSKTSELHQVSGPSGAPVAFVLEVPGVLRRQYRGVLRVRGDGEVLRPVITMDAETATGSIAGAELPVSGTGVSALAAQAVIARSVLLSREGRRRHGSTDFCDTTHCQFLRSPAEPGGTVDRAVCETRGLVLRQDDRTLFARYSGACGGATEGGKQDGFRYSSVACETCRVAGRIRQGHGWGLCQHGALSLAQRGWSWPAILAKYYPDSVVGIDSGTV